MTFIDAVVVAGILMFFVFSIAGGFMIGAWSGWDRIGKKKIEPWRGTVSEREIESLGRYNAERGRGVVHTEEWAAKMAECQERYDAAWRNHVNKEK